MPPVSKPGHCRCSFVPGTGGSSTTPCHADMLTTPVMLECSGSPILCLPPRKEGPFRLERNQDGCDAGLVILVFQARRSFSRKSDAALALRCPDRNRPDPCRLFGPGPHRTADDAVVAQNLGPTCQALYAATDKQIADIASEPTNRRPTLGAFPGDHARHDRRCFGRGETLLAQCIRTPLCSRQCRRQQRLTGVDRSGHAPGSDCATTTRPGRRQRRRTEERDTAPNPPAVAGGVEA